MDATPPQRIGLRTSMLGGSWMRSRSGAPRAESTQSRAIVERRVDAPSKNDRRPLRALLGDRVRSWRPQVDPQLGDHVLPPRLTERQPVQGQWASMSSSATRGWCRLASTSSTSPRSSGSRRSSRFPNPHEKLRCSWAVSLPAPGR